MIQWVVENINAEGKYIFILKKSDFEKYNLKYMFQLLVKDFEIILLNEETDGAARTVLKAKNLINNEYPLAIVNGDQYMKWNSNEFFMLWLPMNAMEDLTFKSTHPQFSFVKTGDDGFVKECSEKKPISDDATAGVYYFRQGKSFVEAANQMIDKKITVDDQYFVCPVYNELILMETKYENLILRRFGLFLSLKVWNISSKT